MLKLKARRGPRALPSLACGGDERGGGVGGGGVEVDFFDEADGELIVGEPDVLTCVDAGVSYAIEYCWIDWPADFSNKSTSSSSSVARAACFEKNSCLRRPLR